MYLKFTKSILRQILILSLMLLSLCSCSSVITKNGNRGSLVDADNPNIQYVGRFDFSNPKKPVYDWAGVQIYAKFEGTGCAIRVEDDFNEYAVTIDNYAPRLLKKDTSKIRIVASGLSDAVPHTILIQKRTEPLVGKGEFLGFILDKGCRLLPPDKRPDKRIEFIGNSITSGYGDEGDSTGCHFSIETENAAMSYASITARALNADYSLVSFSGRGVVRNYGDINKTSIDPMPSLYGRTCFYDTLSKWNFNRWVPQAVVINLGTNDFSTMPYPDKDVFQSAYVNLINRVRSLYPDVTIFCISGPMIGEPCTGYVREVVQLEQKRLKRYNDIYFVEINKSLMAENEWGCDFHPNIAGMKRMADILSAAIKLRMNW